MKIVIDIDDSVFTRLFDNGVDTSPEDRKVIDSAVRKGKPYEEKPTGKWEWHLIVNGEGRPPEGKDVLVQVAKSRFKIGHFCGIMIRQVHHYEPSINNFYPKFKEYPKWFFYELTSIGDHDPIAWTELPKSYKETNNDS